MMRSRLWNASEVEQMRKANSLDPHEVRRFFTACLKKFLATEDLKLQFPWAAELEFHPLRFHQRHDSEWDGATKILFQTEAGLFLETVILRVASGRTTVCVSSQIGCAAACDFCATGKMGIARNLSAAEIVDQVLQAGQIVVREGRRLQNIVFMGMGEPLHNEAALHEALELLVSPRFFAQPASKILVSTVGLPEGMLRLAEKFPQVRQALSLHSVRHETRERLIPLAKRYPLTDLQAAIQAINQRTQARVMIEYLLLAGINDSADDARELIAWLHGLNVHVNLIPYNSIDSAPNLRGSDEQTRHEFAAQLKRAGLITTMRYSLGQDIAAACGQLVRMEHRQRSV